MTIQEKAAKIIDLIGGEKNIKAFTHCITRLRFHLVNDSQADLNAIRKMEGILDVQVQSGQTQVIIGGEVGKVYREILKQFPSLDSSLDSAGGEKKSVFNNILDTLSSILVPSLAPVVGGGMLKGFLYLLVQIKAMDAAGDTYLILNIASDCMFYFFPFLLAVSSAKRFKTNEYMALSLAGALMYPSIIAAVGGETFMFLGFIPIKAYSYASSVLPIILGVWIMSYIYRFFEKVIPSMVSIIFAPLLTLVITIPIVLAGIGPLGYFIGEYIALGIDKIINFAPWLAGFLVAASRPFLVLCGMHHAIRPLTIQQISTYGYSTISAMNFMSTMAQATAAFAIFVLTKNKNSKQIAASSTVSGYFGITEPALYGIIVKYKAAMIGTLLGGGIGGLIATVLGARSYASAMPSILSIPVYFGEGFTGFIIGLVATVLSTFVIIFLLGKSVFRGEMEEDLAVTPATEKKVSIKGRTHVIASPANGDAFPIKDVNDNTFASEIVGKGIAIESIDGNVYAPEDSVVKMLFETKHAVAFETADGVDILIHIGINTVNLKGKYFNTYCEEGQTVKKGERIISFDKDAIQKEGFDTCVIMVISNTNDYLSVIPEMESGNIAVGEKAITIVE